jgi:hypothetical protein
VCDRCQFAMADTTIVSPMFFDHVYFAGVPSSDI